MTEYTAQCRHSRRDTITARASDGEFVELTARFSDRYAGETFLRPDAARTFARGILALADEIDGGEAEVEYVDEPADTRPKVGDRLRVTKSHANFAPVREGQIITVHATDYDNADRPDYIRSFLGDADDYAYFISLDHVEPAGVLDEAGLADWERDLIEGAEAPAEPAPSPFARYVDEAKRLLTDTDHTGADVIALARELSERA